MSDENEALDVQGEKELRNDPLPDPEPPDFRSFHEELDKISRRGFRIETEATKKGRPYVKPKTGHEIKGKQMRKWAKKARHLVLNMQREAAEK